MNSYLNDLKRQKELQKKYLQKKKDKKKHIKFINKLFIRIFFSSLILLFLTYFESFENNFKTYFLDNLNFLSLSSKINNLFGNTILNSGDLIVYDEAFYEKVRYENEVNYISNSSFAGAKALVDGVVIKIEKKNEQYIVYIQSSNDFIYEYVGLESIDVHIYSYVKQNDVIGKAIFKNDKYEFILKIKKDNQYFSYYENIED